MAKKEDSRTFLISVAAELAGIKRIIELTNQVAALQARVQEMAAEIEALRANQRRDVAVVPKSTAVVVWKPRPMRDRT
jgi:MerR family transcriptional regulator/heat shock protein HspR